MTLYVSRAKKVGTYRAVEEKAVGENYEQYWKLTQ